jgi:hypothetical protein
MKKTILFVAAAALVTTQAFATYIVVLKDGTKYTAKTKWTMVAGKARVTLQNGQTLSLNLSDIDVAKSEEMTKLGFGQVSIIGQEQATPANAPRQQQPSLGSTVKLRPRGEFAAPAPPPGPTTSTPSAPTSAAPLADQVDARLKDKFERAYENIGIFEHKITGTNSTLRAELTADNEDKVFNALSATAFLIVRNAGLDDMKIDMVEVFMKTTNGGAAGRFQMSRADAEAVNAKTTTLQDYFVKKVIY